MKIRGNAFSGAGFSLVEFLAVIAILGVLGALLLPLLNRGRASALSVRCAGNLRQLGLATHIYWDENSGRAFRYRNQATNNGVIYWFGWLEEGAETTRRFDPVPGVLYPYLKGRGVEQCPALDYAARSFKLKARGAAYGYGYNLHLSAPKSVPAFAIADLPRPARTALYADAAQVNTFQPPASPTHPLLEEFYYVNNSEATAHFRHNHKANAVFCDGHVGQELPATGSLDKRMPAQWVGRLRDEILLVP